MTAILNNKTWSTYSHSVGGHNVDPEEYSPSAIERLMEDIKDYVVSVKNVRPQFKAVNKTQVISFKTEEQRQRYNKAYEVFLMNKAKIEAKAASSGVVGNMKMQILVEILKFRQAAEDIKVEDIVDAMYASYVAGQAPVASFNFKPSIAKGVKILHDKYGISRDLVSLIWGGGNTTMSAKRKAKLDIKNKIKENDLLASLFEDAGIDMADLGLDQVEAAKTVVIDDSLRLGPQSKEERQREIDKFQKGKSLFCFFTFKSGGVGLSLHHSDELTKEKCRRKESGYVYEEDIPLIPTRQRVLFCATTYSAMELVQALGRCPRLTSLSETPQTILFYRGTIEERVANIVSLKLRCLRKVTPGNSGDWQPVILGGYKQDDKGQVKLLKDGEDAIKEIEEGYKQSPDDEDDGGFIDVGETEEE